jgi:hypothetical protein
MSEYPGALDMFVDDYRVFINQNTHRYLVIHKTAGFETVQDLGEYFELSTLEVSSHFGVGLDGTIAQYVLLKDGAAANCCGANIDNYGGGNINLCTISIEHIDPSVTNSTTPPDAQINASFALVKWLCDKYGIPSANIIRHADIDPVNKPFCPNNYPMDLLRKYVNMPENTTVNEAVVQTWEDCQFVLGSLYGIPPRNDAQGNERGIFKEWRSDLIAGKYRGVPLMNEQNGVDFNGVPIIRQQFSMGMAWWYPETSTIAWSDNT